FLTRVARYALLVIGVTSQTSGCEKKLTFACTAYRGTPHHLFYSHLQSRRDDRATAGRLVSSRDLSRRGPPDHWPNRWASGDYALDLTLQSRRVNRTVAGRVVPSEPIEEVFDQPLTFFCETVRLPFEGRIVYDELLSGYNLRIGQQRPGSGER